MSVIPKKREKVELKDKPEGLDLKRVKKIVRVAVPVLVVLLVTLSVCSSVYAYERYCRPYEFEYEDEGIGVVTGVETNVSQKHPTDVWVTDSSTDRIWHYNKNGTLSGTDFNCSTTTHGNHLPKGFVFNVSDGAPTDAWIVDWQNNTIVHINSTCDDIGGATGNFSFYNTLGITGVEDVEINTTGIIPTDFWVLSEDKTSLYHLNATGYFSPDPTGNFSTSAFGSTAPKGVEINVSNGVPTHFFITDEDDMCIYVVNTTGSLVDKIDMGYPSGPQPYGLATANGTKYFIISDNDVNNVTYIKDPVHSVDINTADIKDVTCESETNITITFNKTGSYVATLDMGFLYGGTDAGNCTYGATNVDNITSSNQSQSCIVKIGIFSITSGYTVNIVEELALAFAVPPNLPAALVSGAVLTIIVIYTVVRKKRSEGWV